MAETTFNVSNYSVLAVRLEPTEIFATTPGVTAAVTLRFRLKLQPVPIQQPGQDGNYALIRFAGKVLMQQNEEIAFFEALPFAEVSYANTFERQFDVTCPLTANQLKRIEELRDGKNPTFRIELTGLVARANGQFEKLSNASLTLTIPRSHWIDEVLNRLSVSDLRLLEIAFPTITPKEMQTAKERLQRAEQFYRTGDYPHVLTSLRLAFAAIAESYSVERADRSLFDKMLIHTHPEMKAKLRDAFDYLLRVLNLGPHEPAPTPEVPIPISQNDARFALVMAHAVFEYFSSEEWPGI